MVETCCHIKRYSVIEIVNGENNKFILANAIADIMMFLCLLYVVFRYSNIHFVI